VTDPYLYPSTTILKNKLGLREQDSLDTAEASYTTLRLKEIKDSPLPGNYNFKHLCAIHKYLFQDMYTWAGQPRTIDIIKHERVLAGLSVDYAKHQDIRKESAAVIRGLKNEHWDRLPMQEQAEKFGKHFAALWRVHPFREGNTRTVTHFFCQFTDKKGMAIDQNLFVQHSDYLREALVAANAIFDDDLGDKSKPEYLVNMILDAMRRAQSPN
jgi:cell filamentation protein